MQICKKTESPTANHSWKKGQINIKGIKAVYIDSLSQLWDLVNLLAVSQIVKSITACSS